MHELLDQLVYSLFKKNSLQECSLYDLKTFAEQYPYYSTAQLLYSARLKESGSEDYKSQLQKTSLHFNSPLWLDHLLNKTEEAGKSEVKIEMNKEEIAYEAFNNDELVVENPRPELFKIKEVLKDIQTQQSVVEIAEQNEPSFTFEPYHTVDYFASQGIKEVQELKPADRLGQQLKSFTEWLKTLKTTPVQEITSAPNNDTEEKVISLADHSVIDRNVVTEAMADVWIKQGQPEKAVAIYNKLSLLDPSKSSYFAGLIENLKKY